MRAIERRVYLRVSDQARVTYRIISEDQEKQSDLAALLGLSHTFSLRKQLYRLEVEARELRREISEQDRKLGSFLHNLNQRIELITDMISSDNSGTQPNVIDLSPAGLSFVADTLYSANTLMALKLEFTNSSLAIASFARVRFALLGDNVGENVGDDDSYRIGVQFTSADPTTEALLERHIATLQAEARRERLHRY